jgi:hypothetical protein
MSIARLPQAVLLRRARDEKRLRRKQREFVQLGEMRFETAFKIEKHLLYCHLISKGVVSTLLLLTDTYNPITPIVLPLRDNANFSAND